MVALVVRRSALARRREAVCQRRRPAPARMPLDARARWCTPVRSRCPLEWGQRRGQARASWAVRY